MESELDGETKRIMLKVGIFLTHLTFWGEKTRPHDEEIKMPRQDVQLPFQIQSLKSF